MILTCAVHTYKSHILLQFCQQVWNKLLTTCDNVVRNLLILLDLLQGCYNKSDIYSHDLTILLQPCVVNLVINIPVISDLSEQPCDKSEMPSSLFQTRCNNWNKQCEHNLSTACEQICNNCVYRPVTICAFLRVQYIKIEPIDKRKYSFRSVRQSRKIEN